ncbi:MAG: divergent polysaccharide deacetylase family protein [Treponema sp.]|nr:divergent polysaccharide deacetylase family protein [Treponema sp.]
MKNSQGKAFPKKQALKPQKRRPRRKKPAFEDRVRAVLVAAVCISAAAVIGAVVFVVHSFSPQAVSVSGAPEAAAPASPGLFPGETPPPAVPEPVSQIPSPEPVSSISGPAAPPAPVRQVPEQTAAPVRPAAPPGSGGSEQPRHKGVLVFMIDDAGNNLRELEPFLQFPGPLTIAVLPGLPYSAEAARRIRAAGKEVFLHQPMEAVGGQDPGPGAIYTGMSPGEIRAVVERNLAEVGPVAGMNNHQGSKITMDETAMEIILSLCREHRIRFLDSRTTAETAAPAAAKRLGLKIGERDVFLDNIQERASMIRSVEEGLERAERKGTAVMIGHTWSPALAPVLTGLYPGLLEQGYTLSTASRIME